MPIVSIFVITKNDEFIIININWIFNCYFDIFFLIQVAYKAWNKQTEKCPNRNSNFPVLKAFSSELLKQDTKSKSNRCAFSLGWFLVLQLIWIVKVIKQLKIRFFFHKTFAIFTNYSYKFCLNHWIIIVWLRLHEYFLKCIWFLL